MNQNLWEVAVNAPLPQTLTYSAEIDDLKPGLSVTVPLGKRTVDAVLVAPVATSTPGQEPENEKFKIKNIIEINEERPRINDVYRQWMKWVSDYYCYPIGQVGQLFFPPLKKKGRGSRKASVIPTRGLEPQSTPPTLTPEQTQVFKDISSSEEFAVHLLHGVTGSGKTEVYLQLLDQVIERGQQGLVLVPEISLTPQLIQRFSQRFGDQVAVIHSHLTEREKTDQWWSMVDGKKKILIGARSALFCPLENLGMIILDEEHEPSFKQEEKLKYHARDAAVMLAHKVGCPVVLGSATPSLESWQNAQLGKYRLHQMKSRVENRAMPEVQIIDLKEKPDEASNLNPEQKNSNCELPFWMSPQLHSALTETLEQKKQSALFLNRRGIAHSLTCPACGDTRECPNCAVSLTLHGKSHLVCHYCNYHENRTDTCSVCNEGEPQTLGLGTEKIEDDLRKVFPEARIARADRDEIQSREQLEELIENMENGHIDILVGTQMIAKGLDFPKLQTVGIVLADVGFHLPDFRSGERIFQLITQVSGRAGRHIKEGERPGQVIVQTYNPDHPILNFSLNHDYVSFAEYELSARRPLTYPPFGRMASFRIQAPELKLVQQAASTLQQLCEALKNKIEKYRDIELLGPVEAPMLKLRNQYRFHLLAKANNPWELVQFCKHVQENSDRLPKKSKLLIDVDPMSLL